ncbi:MAG: hypothetical protein WKF43_12890 [Acidimicrobiales bacterium]
MSDVKTRVRDVLGGPIKGAWRRIRPHLPPRIAEGIRVPIKQALRKAGLIGRRPSRQR